MSSSAVIYGMWLAHSPGRCLERGRLVMQKVRVLFTGLTLLLILSGCAAAPFVSIIPFIQKEREKLLLAKTSPVHASGQVTSPFQLGNEAIALRGLPRRSEAVRSG